jgi:hypothetical protein
MRAHATPNSRQPTTARCHDRTEPSPTSGSHRRKQYLAEMSGEELVASRQSMSEAPEDLPKHELQIGFSSEKFPTLWLARETKSNCPRRQPAGKASRKPSAARVHIGGPAQRGHRTREQPPSQRGLLASHTAGPEQPSNALRACNGGSCILAVETRACCEPRERCCHTRSCAMLTRYRGCAPHLL